MGILKRIFLVVLILMLPLDVWAACETPCTKVGTTYTCTNASYDCVNDAVQAATAEDTINITDTIGRTWESRLVIPRGINLIGPGAGNLTITSGINPTIIYAPSAATGASDYALRISGFTFNTGAYSGIILCGSTGGNCTTSNNMGAVAQTKIRIDNNTFTTTTHGVVAIEVKGAFRGVVDSNTFTGYSVPHRAWGTGLGLADWAAFGELTYGTADNMYFEDNTYTVGGYMVSDCDQGGRYAFRYNDITLDGNLLPLFEQHLGRTVGSTDYYACFGGEIYGNKVTRGSYSASFMAQHASRFMSFYNQASNGASRTVVQQNASGSWSVCPPETYRAEQTVNNSYYWNNRQSVTGAIVPAEDLGDTCTAYPITENTTHWTQRSGTFDGAGTNGGGVGCGTLANRPGTCTTGVGYWATDQSCADLTDHIGASPTTPISGTLYKCTATNTWTAYYTPYTYPHPLRGEADVAAPTATWQIDSTGLIATATFSENVNATTKTGVSFTGSVTGAITATYKDGMPGGIVRYDLGSEVQQSETVVVDYTTPGDGIKDLAGNALADILDGAVSNGSTQNTPPLVTLTIGTHTGATVNVYPGINCGSTCGPVEYDNGAVLTLSVQALANYTGCTIAGTGCGASTTMSESRTCTVTCTKISPDATLGSGAAVTLGSGAVGTIK